MEHNIKPITKQLIIAAIILASVTVLSFGIRRVRFSAYRAYIVEPTASVRPSETEDRHQLEEPRNANAEPGYYPVDSYMADTEPALQDTKESFWDEQAVSDDYSEENTDSIDNDKDALKTESFKDNYAKAEGKKDLQKISLSDHEELYFSEEGEFWYVSKQPDGSTTKMQVKINDTGEFIAVGGGDYIKQEPQRIPIGENEDIYLTEEGQAWYVSEQPDGDTLKMQVHID